MRLKVVSAALRGSFTWLGQIAKLDPCYASTEHAYKYPAIYINIYIYKYFLPGVRLDICLFLPALPTPAGTSQSIFNEGISVAAVCQHCPYVWQYSSVVWNNAPHHLIPFMGGGWDTNLHPSQESYAAKMATDSRYVCMGSLKPTIGLCAGVCGFPLETTLRGKHFLSIFHTQDRNISDREWG